MKKIAIIFHDSDFLSGATHSMIDICEYWLQNKMCEIIAFFPREGTAVEYLRSLNVTTYINYYWDMRRRNSEKAIFSLTRWPMRQYYNIKSYISAIKMSKIITIEKVDIIYSNTSSNYMGVWLKKLTKKKTVYHVREFGIEDQGFMHFHGDKYFYKKLKNIDNIIVISKSLEAKYRKELPNSSISVVYNDISSKYDNYTKHDWSSSINIMSCGAVIPGKGHKDAIDAIAALNNSRIKLFIVGNDKTEYAEKLKEYIKENSYDTFVTFTGIIKDLNSFRKKINIGIVASKKEAFGRITIEGMLSNLLIIASNSGANPELISHMKTGLLYEEGNYRDLSKKIDWSIKNINKVEKITEDAYEYAQNFCCGNCAKNILEILNK